MSFLKHFNDVLQAGEGNYLKKFQEIKRVDVQIAIYQKLLYKAGEEGKDSAAQKALNSINDALQNWFPEDNLEENLGQVINAKDGNYLDEFKKFEPKVQVLIYRKLRDKAVEEGNESAAQKALDSINVILQKSPSKLDVRKALGHIIKAGKENYLTAFKEYAGKVDVQIAIYQQLLHLAAIKGKNSAAQKALEAIDKDFENWSPEFKALKEFNDAFKEYNDALKDFTELQSGIEIENKRYAVAKANAIYQDYLYRKTFERVKNKDKLLFDPQARLVYELTLTKEERKEVLDEIKEALQLQDDQELSGSKDVEDIGVSKKIIDSIMVDAKLKELLGGRTPTKTTLCSIDLGCIDKAPKDKDSKEIFKELRTKFVAKYGRQNLVAHQRASMVASFEESYAHMCLMAKTYRGVSKHFDKEKPRKITKADWEVIRHEAALKLQDKVAETYKKAVAEATTQGVVDLYKLNKNLAKERVKLADFSKKILIEGVVEHLKAKKMERTEILRYMQNLSSRVEKHSFTDRTATGYDYFYTSNYLQQGMLITGTESTAHNKPHYKANSEDQAAFRRVTYTYRDEDGVLQPTSAVSSRIPSPALVFHGMSDELIKKDLVQKFGFLHEQMRAMRGGKDGPAVESLFTSFHSAAYERLGDNNNRQRASALYIIQAMHDFNTPWHIRVEKLKEEIDKFQKKNPSLANDVKVAQDSIKNVKNESQLEDLINQHKETFAKQRYLEGLLSELESAEAQAAIQQQEQPPKNNFLYIQNIGTNRQTRDLGYRQDRGIFDVTGSLELDDITLSAEMAMLHTLQENSAFLSDEVKEQLSGINAKVLTEYRKFLEDKSRPIYFAESKQGENLIKEIRTFKEVLKNQLDNEAKIKVEEDKIEPNHLPSLASNTLARMIATNQHWDSRYGQLSQALSMYIEWASTGGCKSGNERNQDVMLRFGLLKSIHERVEHAGNENGLKAHERAIYEQMTAYTKGETADPEALRAAIATSVSKCNMHGGAAAISREDQGGAAKVSSFSAVQDIRSPFLQWTARIALLSPMLLIVPLVALAFPKVRKFYSDLFDTNNAADKEMKLDATGASKTQAHKGQDKRTRDVVLQVLNDDPSFQGKNKLTSAEKDLFKEGRMEELEKKEQQKTPEAQKKREEPKVDPVVLSDNFDGSIEHFRSLGGRIPDAESPQVVSKNVVNTFDGPPLPVLTKDETPSDGRQNSGTTTPSVLVTNKM
ncbi:hypothetical protein [Legionella sp. WA2022007384]